MPRLPRRNDAEQPSPSVPNGGRNARGRFVKGNKLGKGNPLGQRVQALRVSLVDSVSTDDFAAVTKRLVKEALAGDVQAAKLLFDRVLGPSVAVDLVLQIEAMEEEIKKLQNGGQ